MGRGFGGRLLDNAVPSTKGLLSRSMGRIKGKGGKCKELATKAQRGAWIGGCLPHGRHHDEEQGGTPSLGYGTLSFRHSDVRGKAEPCYWGLALHHWAVVKGRQGGGKGPLYPWHRIVGYIQYLIRVSKHVVKLLKNHLICSQFLYSNFF
ncbi:hypothetical protein R1flu_008497 [Riccia fluitans]|uniref:Uncharacterized protein n=1 Tax=Riccia fluitans TaxID=41844 RepID=A0ABD1YBX4_9MARC